MTTVTMSRGTFPIFILVLVASIAFLEYSGLVQERGGLLLTLVFWTALLQGSVAAAAVADLTHARWIVPLRRELLAASHLLSLPPLLLLVMAPLLDLYPWSKTPGLWLNETFFLLRNLAVLLAVYGAGRLYARRALKDDPDRFRWAIIYLFLFVASQTLVAYDWVMSLEYPWISTLFGPYFFVEALYGGLALAGILFLLFPECRGKAFSHGSPPQWDIGLLLFGFSILWGGLFFAQFLLLWYGNLPEEVQFIARRLDTVPLRILCAGFLACNFLTPFLVLLSRRAKRSAAVVGLVAAIVLMGIMAERLLFIAPVVPISSGLVLGENVLLLAFWLLTVHSRELLLPPSKLT